LRRRRTPTSALHSIVAASSKMSPEMTGGNAAVTMTRTITTMKMRRR